MKAWISWSLGRIELQQVNRSQTILTAGATGKFCIRLKIADKIFIQ